MAIELAPESKAERTTRRLYGVFGFFSFALLLLCAAFADRTARAAGLPPMAVYIAAGVAAVLTIAISSATLSSLPFAAYLALAILYTVVAVGLAVVFAVFAIDDADGSTTATALAPLWFIGGLLLVTLALLAGVVARRGRLHG